MMTLKTITEETREACPVCGGQGNHTEGSCQTCRGTGQVLTRTITRREVFDLDELADAISRRMTERLRSRGV